MEPLSSSVCAQHSCARSHDGWCEGLHVAPKGKVFPDSVSQPYRPPDVGLDLSGGVSSGTNSFKGALEIAETTDGAKTLEWSVAAQLKALGTPHDWYSADVVAQSYGLQLSLQLLWDLMTWKFRHLCAPSICALKKLGPCCKDLTSYKTRDMLRHAFRVCRHECADMICVHAR